MKHFRMLIEKTEKKKYLWNFFNLIKVVLQSKRGLGLSQTGPWSVKFLYTSLYTWSDLMICFDSELFPQNFVGQLNNDQKSLDLYYECLK